MDNNQYYSCERNHYFFGKLMTVRDFESEQVYFNSKRRLGNRMLNGAGIVSGLDVILVDNRTFSLEAGMAIDYLGREIVVAEPSVRRLSIIKGFEENVEKSDMYLCLEYKENLKETTFSVASSGKDSGVSKEYNRIQEGYDLFLTADKPDKSTLSLDHLVVGTVVLYEKNGIKLSLEVSKYVNPSKLLRLTVVFEKENVSSPVSYNFDVSGEFFKAINGEKTLSIEYNEAEVSTYKNVRKNYYMVCDAVTDAFVDINVLKKSFSIKIGKEKGSMENDITQAVNVTTRSLRDVIIENYYAKHFDEVVEPKENQRIYLAKFHVVSNQSTYFIEGFEKHPFNQYLLSNELLSVLQTVDDEFGSGLVSSNVDIAPKKVVKQESIVQQIAPDNIITGVERINLGFNPKVGKPYYSYEFVHGLGYGKMGVIVSVENKANYLTNDDNLVVFGDRDVFNDDQVNISTPNVQIGAILNPDKGTMKIGVKLLEKTTLQAIDIRWWAFKPSNNEQSDEEVVVDDNIKVVITPNTTRVEPLGQVRFVANIEGASSQEIVWSMVEENSGTIDNNGLYTAPSKEGVYEVRAQSAKYQDKFDSAYVVVSVEE